MSAFSPDPSSLVWWRQAWNTFFHREETMLRCCVFRIVFGSLLLVNVLVWWPNLEMWFGQEGVLDYQSSRAVIDRDTLTLFRWLPQTDVVLWSAYGLLLLHLIGLIAGVAPRWNALGVFVWFTSFQHRNLLIFDAEDYLFRILAFLLLLMPSGHALSVARFLPGKWKRLPCPQQRFPVWPLRLAQIQITLVYLSSAWEKLRGDEWLDGLAIYYVTRLDDLFGRFPLPSIFFESLFVMKLTTWTVLAIECFLPIGLWLKETRRIALVLGISLHLVIDYSMNLFLFHWLMIAGLLLFSKGNAWRAGTSLVGRRRPHAVPQGSIG